MLRGLATFATAALWCAAASGQTEFISHMHVVPTAMHPISAGAVAHMSLSVDPYRLHYSIALEDLDLEPAPANRVDQNDVIGIHMHFIVPGVTGPHILNIFGVPGEEDADLAVDYANEMISGIYDISDATLDPATGEPYPQFFFITTKIIDDWIDELVSNQLYLAVHTAGENGQALLHGDVIAVPEPATSGLLATGMAALAGVQRRRRRRCVDVETCFLIAQPARRPCDGVKVLDPSGF